MPPNMVAERLFGPGKAMALLVLCSVLCCGRWTVIQKEEQRPLMWKFELGVSIREQPVAPLPGSENGPMDNFVDDKEVKIKQNYVMDYED